MKTDRSGSLQRLSEAVDGFFGASSIERLPTAEAIEQQTKGFEDITLGDA